MNTHVIELCEMAEDALFDAQCSGDIAYVAEALSLYKEALAYNAPLAAPYLGLACIAYARGEHQQVQGLLGLAERLEPTHPDVLELKQRLLQSTASDRIDASATSELIETLPIARLSLAPEVTGGKGEVSSSTEAALALTQDLGPPLEKSAISEGPEVLLLQHILTTLGYAVHSSGKFDAATRSALAQFQHHRGLRLRRVVDHELREALMKSLIEG